jgi:hypothetical protein
MGVQCRVHFIVSKALHVGSNVPVAQMIPGYRVPSSNETEDHVSLIPTQVLTEWMKLSAYHAHGSFKATGSILQEHSGIMGQINWLSLRFIALVQTKKDPASRVLWFVSVRSHRGDRQCSADGQIGRIDRGVCLCNLGPHRGVAIIGPGKLPQCVSSCDGMLLAGHHRR